MGRAVGIGGIFFRSEDPKASRAWYAKNLGLNADMQWGTSFEWLQAPEGTKKGFTLWNPFPRDTDYFGESGQQFMLNFRVDDLDALIEKLRADGVTIAKEIESYEYGKFAHVVDGDGHRVELWEPNDDEYEKIAEAVTK